MSRPRCCRPDEVDEDRTHHVSYEQVQLHNGTVVWTDLGSELACTHTDAIADAELMAGRFDCRMRQLGQNGTWRGSDITEGDGQRVDVWISRTPGDIDYDEARARAEAEASHA